MPILPFFYAFENIKVSFAISSILTALAFFSIGMAKGYILKLPMIKEGLEVLVFSGVAASMAYLVSHWVAITYGV